MESFLEFIVLLAFGAACAAIAHGRGRNPIAWFFLGFLGNCFALILLLVLPDMAELDRKHDDLEDKNRRLREEIAHERARNQAFRGHVKARLDVHDAALQIDTREQTPMTELPPPPPEPVRLVDSDLPQEGWFIAEAGGDAEGPLSLADLEARALSSRLRPQTLIWNAEYDREWMPVRDTPVGDALA